PGPSSGSAARARDAPCHPSAGPRHQADDVELPLPELTRTRLTLRRQGAAFFDFPAEHWKHLRTSNVIESPFVTVWLRQRVTKGAGSRTKGLLMAYKLLDVAQARWRRLDGAHLLPLVRAGIVFVDGVQQEGKASKMKGRAA